MVTCSAHRLRLPTFYSISWRRSTHRNRSSMAFQLGSRLGWRFRGLPFILLFYCLEEVYQYLFKFYSCSRLLVSASSKSNYHSPLACGTECASLFPFILPSLNFVHMSFKFSLVDANGTRYNSFKPLCCIRLIYQFLVPVYHYKKKGVQKSEMFYLII